ncbi:hypothetical protein JCM33374_g1358 [Metschnikowia sp. JCM 33374]|nr:hypothetical protein JCM33374_g1358 [Metschnikowia sp. JCM 33374]
MSADFIKKEPDKTENSPESYQHTNHPNHPNYQNHQNHQNHQNRTTPTLKIVLLGDSGVGKTCLRSQFVHHVFSNAYKATIGGDYLTTTVDITPTENHLPQGAGSRDHGPDSSDPGSVSPQTVSLQVWDTAGQERFNSISQTFYRGADVAVLVYDITSYESLLSVRDWFARFLQHCQVKSPGVVIVGNKLDRQAERAVDAHEVKDVLCRNGPVAFADHVTDWHKDVLEISCKQLGSVEEVFRRVATIGMEKTHANHQQDRCAGIPTVVLDDTQAVSSRCAC